MHFVSAFVSGCFISAGPVSDDCLGNYLLWVLGVRETKSKPLSLSRAGSPGRANYNSLFSGFCFFEARGTKETHFRRSAFSTHFPNRETPRASHGARIRSFFGASFVAGFMTQGTAFVRCDNMTLELGTTFQTRSVRPPGSPNERNERSGRATIPCIFRVCCMLHAKGGLKKSPMLGVFDPGQKTVSCSRAPFGRLKGKPKKKPSRWEPTNAHPHPSQGKGVLSASLQLVVVWCPFILYIPSSKFQTELMFWSRQACGQRHTPFWAWRFLYEPELVRRPLLGKNKKNNQSNVDPGGINPNKIGGWPSKRGLIPGNPLTNKLGFTKSRVPIATNHGFQSPLTLSLSGPVGMALASGILQTIRMECFAASGNRQNIEWFSKLGWSQIPC